MEGAEWINPESDVWFYIHPRLGTLGAVWKDLGLYAATGPLSVEGDYHHAELGEYSTLQEAKEIVEGVASGGVIRLKPSPPRDLGTVEGGYTF